MKTRLIAEFLGLKPIGIVLNRVRGEEFELTRDEIKNIMDLPVLAEIPEDDEVKKALNQGKILVQASPRSPASKAIEGLARKLAKMRAK